MRRARPEETGELEPEHGGAAAGAEPVSPRPDPAAELEAARRERDEFLSRWQRAQADYQNLRRRSQAEHEAAARRAVQGVLEGLLLGLDNLDLALAAPASNDESKSLAAGVRLTRDLLLRALEQEGVSLVPEGGVFDPALHQAIATVERADTPPGTIIETTRRGYVWRHGILRHAQVRVAAPPPTSAGEGAEVRSAGEAEAADRSTSTNPDPAN